MSNTVEDSNVQKFVLIFFTQISNAVDVKTGGRKNNKRYKNGGNDNDPDLPVFLNKTNINHISKVKQSIQSESLFKQNFNIKIVPSHGTSMTDINSEFAQHIKAVLDNIGEKRSLEITHEELQALSLFINYKSLLFETKKAANVLLQLSSSNKIIIEDTNSDENIQMVSSLLKNVPRSSNLADKQISSQFIGSFLNLFGRLSVLLNLILCYTNRLSTYKTNLTPLDNTNADLSACYQSQSNSYQGHLNDRWCTPLDNTNADLSACYQSQSNSYQGHLNDRWCKTTNPVIYFIITSLYSCIFFVMFCIFKIFLCLINTKLGKCYLILVFLNFYRNDNKIAVFIANNILKLLHILDDYLDVSVYVNTSIESVKQTVIDNMPTLVTMFGVKSLLISTLSSALLKPEVMANFVSLISPQLTSQILEQSLPALTEATSTAVAQLGPALIEGVTTTTSTAVTHLSYDLIEEVTFATSTTVTQALAQVSTQVSTQVATQEIANTAVNSLTTVAFKYGVQAVSYYLTGNPSVGNLLTNFG